MSHNLRILIFGSVMSGELPNRSVYASERNTFLPDITRFVLWGDNLEHIGSGGFGDVYKCSMSGQPVAVKVLRARSYINECDGSEEKAWSALSRVSASFSVYVHST